MPCPNGVDIPVDFELYNESVMFEKPDLNRFRYNNLLSAEERADACIACRECEEKCPQQIEISAWMPTVHELLVNPESQE
jgi:predicted aldo/keto reductase-like oxidoreductase